MGNLALGLSVWEYIKEAGKVLWGGLEDTDMKKILLSHCNMDTVNFDFDSAPSSQPPLPPKKDCVLLFQ